VRSVGILIVGDEILRGEVADENGPFLIRRLGGDGVLATRQVVVGDEREAITQELARLRALSDAVVVSGGIGPTHDDVTREAVAEALSVPLVAHAAAAEAIRGFYGAATTDAELGMSLLPDGARLVRGPRTGTFGFEAGGVYGFPGVPFLFRDLVEGIAAEFLAPPLHRAEIVSVRREGEIAPFLAEVQGAARDVAIGSYPVCERGSWRVRVVVRGADPARVESVRATLAPRL
jgi:molybdenum cofactor synthesis domain-containing protein